MIAARIAPVTAHLHDAEVGTGRERGEPRHEGRIGSQRSEAADDQIQPEEDHPEADGRQRDVADPLLLDGYLDDRGHAEQREPVLANRDDQDPIGDRRADVGAHDEADRLRQREDAAVHEPHDHHGHQRAGLHDRGHDGAGEHGEKAVGDELADEGAHGPARQRLDAAGHVFEAEEQQSQSADRPEGDLDNGFSRHW